jgi:hypothetical protein
MHRERLRRSDVAFMQISKARAIERAETGVVSYQISEFYAPAQAIGRCTPPRPTILFAFQPTVLRRSWVRSLGFLIHFVVRAFP